MQIIASLEWIVFLEQDQLGKIGHVAEHARDGESCVRGAPQCCCGTVVVKALEVQRAVGWSLLI